MSSASATFFVSLSSSHGQGSSNHRYFLSSRRFPIAIAFAALYDPFASRTREVDGDFLADDAAHQLGRGLMCGLPKEVEEALFHVRDRAPERLPGELVIRDVNFVDEAFEVARILADEARDHAPLQDR